ncbi:MULTISPECIES: DUF4405 domain-containing protein [Methylomonas]|uniref:Cytochrome c domain-containing protein n=2 Tax=Methylomonas TaxID=416 RepID=A0A140E4V8_9GAMM|nr:MULTISPECIES: DUF4405 domain-containing protein [Methylomonas]AMK75432.1 hypothetical protein JT25_002825 [Methylomonas denitrificans]OAI01218.1 hypothetical protein A1342_19400 [Methylomonas methanica]TCV78128.1 cytochrome c [Methylomonas methanica]
MNRTLVNVIIDLVAALLFLGMIATGYLLRFPLPPGSNKTLTLWGLSRHQWGNIHFWISLGLLAILMIHLALHWNWIVTVIGKRCHLLKTLQPSLVHSAIWTLGVLIMLCVAFGWLAQRDVKALPQPICSSVSSNDQVETQNPDLHTAESITPQAKTLVWDDIYPIFATNCLDCHGPRKQYAGFRVDRLDNFFKNDVHPSLVMPGQSSQSTLIPIISGTRTIMAMAERHKLSESEVSRISTWIDQGAK